MLTSKNIAIKEIQPFDLQRKVVSHIMSSSWKNIPHVSYLYEPDITDFYNEFNKLAVEHSQNATEPHKISFNTILLKTIVEGLLAAPKLNSLLEYNPRTVEGRLLVCADINISLPWLLADGRMITPIVAKADKMSLNAISDAVAALKLKIENTNIDEMLYKSARADTVGELKRLNFSVVTRVLSTTFGSQKFIRLHGEEKKRYYSLPEELRLTEKEIMDGTVTVSNIGSLYREQQGYFGLLEIVPPQVLAVGISAIQEKPGVFLDDTQKQQIGIRKFVPICLVFDHRAVDFDTLVPFLKRLDEIFAHPQEIHSW
ncbi:MAG: 2-oxo acid dehydrogenase subunit E2 [Anaerolineaceae bacterium]|jgi:pyruvate dehydrogenase E2 component (dihydrolipoamide acetyltransferase)